MELAAIATVSLLWSRNA